VTEPNAGVTAFRSARADVMARIAAACARVDRDPATITLVAVSKTVAADRLRDAVAAGFTTLGENRVQEGAAKVDDVLGATWHLIGPLQSNKVRRAVEAFDVVQSIDSIHLAARVDRVAREVRGAGRSARYPVMLQVNIDDDPAKAGFSPGDLAAAIVELASLDALEFRGLMTIGRLVPDAEAARPTFRSLRTLSERLSAGGAGDVLGPALSMGMTDDFEVAVEEGATVVRIGRAIFGERAHGHDDGTPAHVHRASPAGDHVPVRIDGSDEDLGTGHPAG
jgi:PLP dependent protein